MLYDYTNFTKDFCKHSTSESLKNIQDAQSFNLVAISGVGITYFLKYLESKSRDRFILVNTYEMPEFSKDALYQQLVIKLGGLPAKDLQENIQIAKKRINELLSTQKNKLVIVFNRTDRLSRIIDQSLFDNLRFLRDQDRSRVVMIFVSSLPLMEKSTREVKDILTLFSKTVFFRPYDEAGLKEILSLNSSSPIIQSAITLSGGHHNLYNVLIRCQNLDNALSDSMVELLIKDMYFSLDRKRRDELEKVAKRRKITEDEFLIGTGFVKRVSNHMETFTPLLSEYIKEETDTILPVMEQRLFDVLCSHKGDLVDKETIFDQVWKEQDGIASEWSLNSLIYRLRNHAGFDKNRFVIKSAKKIGYILYDSFDE